MEIIKIAVNGTLYDIKDTVTSINGKSGAIGALDIASVLTEAGYKLTDTDTDTVTSINGKTGDIGAQDIASVLIASGYKLTDTDTNTWRPVQCKGTDIGSNTLNFVAGDNVNLTNSGGTITITSSYMDTWRPLGTGSGDACAGNDPRLSNARPASDVYDWAKAPKKPKYYIWEVMMLSYLSIDSNASSACSIEGSNNSGKAQTIIYNNNNSYDLTVTVPTAYKTPNDEAIELTCPAGGYCEVSFLNVDGTIFARGL